MLYLVSMCRRKNPVVLDTISGKQKHLLVLKLHHYNYELQLNEQGVVFGEIACSILQPKIVPCTNGHFQGQHLW